MFSAGILPDLMEAVSAGGASDVIEAVSETGTCCFFFGEVFAELISLSKAFEVMMGMVSDVLLVIVSARW
jgi:hypothetical protein